jgi:hypothetical protein
MHVALLASLCLVIPELSICGFRRRAAVLSALVQPTEMAPGAG